MLVRSFELGCCCSKPAQVTLLVRSFIRCADIGAKIVSNFAIPFLEEVIEILFHESMPLFGHLFCGAGVHPVFQ